VNVASFSAPEAFEKEGNEKQKTLCINDM